MRSNDIGEAVRLTATGDVTTKDCALIGFFISATSSGTVTLRRGGSGGDIIVNGPALGLGWHDCPMDCPGGLHHTEGGTDLDITFVIQPYS